MSLHYRHFKNFTINNFRIVSDIQAQSWNDLKGIENPNDCGLSGKLYMFLEVCDKHAPVRTRRTRASKTPLINSELKSNDNAS